MTSAWNYMVLISDTGAQANLTRSFVSVPDLAQSTFAPEKGIDVGVVIGPRVWPADVFISITEESATIRCPTSI